MESRGAASLIAAIRSSGGGPARSCCPLCPIPPGWASAIACQTSAASAGVSRASTSATAAGLAGRSSGTAASGAIASTMPRLALDRVTDRAAVTAARIVRPSGTSAACSIDVAIARPAATSSAWVRSGNSAVRMHIARLGRGGFEDAGRGRRPAPTMRLTRTGQMRKGRGELP